jgi:hypothetical protein
MNMKHRKLRIVGVVVGIGLLLMAVNVFLDDRSEDEVRYNKLVSLRQAESRFMGWRSKPVYQFVFTKLTRFDPVSHYRGKADELERSLRKSRALVMVSFYPPSFLESGATNAYRRRLFFASNGLPYYASFQNSEAQYVYRSLHDDDGITLTCRPRDVAYWQSAFCAITNRVQWGKLYKLGGNSEEIMCQLPDGTIVDLNACHKWLNASIASGWMVGVCYSNRVILTSRRKPGVEIE